MASKFTTIRYSEPVEEDVRIEAGSVFKGESMYTADIDLTFAQGQTHGGAIQVHNGNKEIAVVLRDNIIQSLTE